MILCVILSLPASDWNVSGRRGNRSGYKYRNRLSAVYRMVLYLHWSENDHRWSAERGRGYEDVYRGKPGQFEHPCYHGSYPGTGVWNCNGIHISACWMGCQLRDFLPGIQDREVREEGEIKNSPSFLCFKRKYIKSIGGDALQILMFLSEVSIPLILF